MEWKILSYCVFLVQLSNVFSLCCLMFRYFNCLSKLVTQTFFLHCVYYTRMLVEIIGHRLSFINLSFY